MISLAALGSRLRSFSEDACRAAAGTLGVAASRGLLSMFQKIPTAVSRGAMAERRAPEKSASQAAAPPAMTARIFTSCSTWLSARGTLAESEKEIILQIISLDQRTARDVMRPRANRWCASPTTRLVEE